MKNLKILYSLLLLSVVSPSIFAAEIVDNTFISKGIALDVSSSEDTILNIYWHDDQLRTVLHRFSSKCSSFGQVIGTAIISVEGQAVSFTEYCHKEGHVAFFPSSDRGRQFVIDVFNENEKQAVQSKRVREKLKSETGEKFISPFDPRLKNIPLGGHLLEIGNLHYSSNLFLDFLSNDRNKPL